MHSSKILIINYYYANHIVKTIETFGQLRYVSARVMERSIGLINDNIKSRQNPAVNSFNYVKDRFAYMRRGFNEALRVDQTIIHAFSPTEVVHGSDFIDVIGTNTITKVQFIYPSKSGLKIAIKGNRVNNLI